MPLKPGNVVEADSIGVAISSSLPKVSGRDFDKEARGKTLCALLQPLMPMLVDVSGGADKVKEQLVFWRDFVMSDPR